MSLDARHKAMLREMGVRLWWPTRSAPAQPTAAQPTEASTASSSASGQASDRPPGQAMGHDPAPATRVAPPATAPTPKATAPKAPTSVAVTSVTGTARNTGSTAGSPPASLPRSEPAQMPTPAGPGEALHWQIGPLQALHPGPDEAPRWLLLSEQRQENGWGPGGQASELLQRMLHAARLHQGSQVWLAPMQRSAQGGVQGLEQALALEPDLVFIMGRLAAQALLETAEPLGRLRGQVHELWGTPAIVSYDCVTLLRNPADKAKAWDDLCLALQVAREQHTQRLEAG